MKSCQNTNTSTREGDPLIEHTFNPDSFINVNKLGFEAAIDAIKFLDQNDKEYLDMIRQPAFIHPDEISATYQHQLLRGFFGQIFDCPTLNDAYRYNRDDYVRSLLSSFLLNPEYLVVQKYSIKRALKKVITRIRAKFCSK